jgi:DedD protein
MSSRNEKRFEFRLGKQGLLLFAAGMSVLVFASFWVGLQMGRNMETPTIQISRVPPPVQIDKGNPPAPVPGRVPEGPAAGPQAASAPAPGAAPAPQAASSGSGAPVPAQPGARPAASPPANASASRAASPQALPAVQKGAGPTPAEANGRPPAPRKEADSGKPAALAPGSPPAAQGARPAEGSPKKATDPAKGSVTAKETFNLQVASYKQRAKAEETAKRLVPLGFKPRVLAVDLPAKGRWYRVVVSGFESREAAQKAAARISKKIKGLSCIVHKA